MRCKMKRLVSVVVLTAIIASSVLFVSAEEKKSEQKQAPAGHPAMPQAPATAPAAAATEPVFPLSGKVVETMNSGGYTYMCLENKGVRSWVAAPEMKVSVGQEVTFDQGSPMVNFASKSLNRTFDKIFFCGPPVSQTGAATESVGGVQQSPGSKGAQVSSDEKIKVEKASGANAYTVAEIYKKKAKLNKKQVVIRGKVVKVSQKIMGKNWVHLQDGSGNQKKGTNNLVITTNDLPAVGDIVTVTGVFIKDRDFGAGYKYEAIIEDAAVKK
jgi:hypothetical protein